jgi:hypothetical protein
VVEELAPASVSKPLKHALKSTTGPSLDSPGFETGAERPPQPAVGAERPGQPAGVESVGQLGDVAEEVVDLLDHVGELVEVDRLGDVDRRMQVVALRDVGLGLRFVRRM